MKLARTGLAAAVLCAALVGGITGGVAQATFERTPDNTFFAEWWWDTMHCGKGNSAIDTQTYGSHYVNIESQSSDWLNYCMNIEYYGAGYLTANAQLIMATLDGNGLWCGSTGWQSNATYTWQITVQKAFWHIGEGSNCPPGWYQTFGQQQNAIILAWRYGDERTGFYWTGS